MMTICILVWV